METTELSLNKIQIDYVYRLHADKPLLYPINWLFSILVMRPYIKQVLENIRGMALNEEPYWHD